MGLRKWLATYTEYRRVSGMTKAVLGQNVPLPAMLAETQFEQTRPRSTVKNTDAESLSTTNKGFIL